MKDTDRKDNRLYPKSPTACASAVVLKEGRILMVKRANEPNRGKWSIPGGGIELGESIYQAAEREVLEECSIKIKIERVLDAAENMVKDDQGRTKYHYVIIDLLGRYVSGRLEARSDAAECGWFTPEEAGEMDITPTLRAMLERQGILKQVDE